MTADRRALIVGLVRNPALAAGDLDGAISALTEAASEGLGFERASVWLYDEARTEIRCLDLYRRAEHRHERGTSVTAASCPAYFAAMESGLTIAASKALTDPRTRELIDYLVDHGIGAMLDAPIIHDGRVVGVCCLEHVGPPREFEEEELFVAGSLAHFVAWALTARERGTAQAALEIANTELEAQVKARTLELESAYQQLRETHRQLAESEKLATVGSLLAGLAHEINHPLAAISSMQDTLQKAHERLGQEGPSERLTRIFKDADRVFASASDRMRGIVARLRRYARKDQLELEPVDLHELLEDTLGIVAHELRGGITVERDFGTLPLLECYRGQLGQVFLNIIINAIQAMPSGGTLRLTTRAQPGQVEVELADTGSGMAPEVQARLFEPGFTTKPVGLGTGLGLSICDQLVRGHQGRIEVHSQVGQGTRFVVVLPTDLATRLGPG